MNWLATIITYLTARFREKTRLLLWHYGKLFIPLTSSYVLSFFLRCATKASPSSSSSGKQNEKTSYFLLFSAHLFVPLQKE